MAGANARSEAEFKQQKFAAWHIAMLPYFKKSIPLDEFVDGKKRRANGQELMMRAQSMHKYFGGGK